jgi:threonine dehydrogenase-like Zn-dependent dehydrogenase
LPGVFVGPAVPAPLGAFIGKGLTLKTGQTHVQRYLEPLMDLIVEGKIDPSFLITHRIGLEEGTGGLQDVPRQTGRLREGGHPSER